MATGIVRLDSDLKRRKWMREGLVQASSISFWSPMTGSSKDAIVFQANNENSGSGHTVVFDYDGNLSGKAIKGKDTAFGKGEEKRKFSDKVTVERYRLVADNGDKFDGVDIGDLKINEHSDSRAKLGDLFVRFKDQALFDAAQGNLITNEDGLQDASHVIDTGSTFDFGTLLDIEKTLRTSQGYTTGAIRRPLDPYTFYKGENGMYGREPCWLMVLDAHMANLLRKDVAGWQTVMKDGDVRGQTNRNISGMLGKVGRLMLVEAPTFFGETKGASATSGHGLDDSEVEIAGMRQLDVTNGAWTGQDGFDYAATLKSRGLILGAGALQAAFGKQPDYKFKTSQDFDIKSESAVEFWMEARKTHLKSETKKYKSAKISDIDYGVVAVDVQVQA